MCRVVAVHRNSKHTVVYMVIRDAEKNQMEVVRYDPSDGLRLTSVRIWSFSLHPDGWHRKSHSETEAYNEATALAFKMSREPAPSMAVR